PADYLPTTGTATIGAGELSTTITVPVVGDLLEKPQRTFLVRLSGAVGAKMGRGEARVTIKAHGAGYWLAGADGGVYGFGDARFYGSVAELNPGHPVVGMAATPSGNGYWLVASDGGIFAFGDAAFSGSTASMTLSHPIVGMAATAGGSGYWLVASDGAVFSFGDAAFFGSAADMTLSQPVV